MRQGHRMRWLAVAALTAALTGGWAQAAGWRIEAAPTGSMAHARARHQASALPDGQVLVTGGLETRVLPLPGVFVLARAERFDPLTGRFTLLTEPMTEPRWDHAAAALPDGRVLLAGGRTTFARYTGQATASTELFDPATGRFTPGPAMSHPRAVFTATPLPDGRVVLAGGTAAQVFDPATDTLGPPISLRVSRVAHQAVALDATRVLLVGGNNRRAGASAEVVDVQTGISQMLAVQMNPPRNDMGLALMPSGEVLVLAGQRSDTGDTLGDILAFVPHGDRSARLLPDAVPNPDGLSDMAVAVWGRRVLIAGGEAERSRVDVIAPFAWLLDGPTGLELARTPLTVPRDDLAWAELPPTPFGWHRLLLVGGLRPDPSFGELPTADAEILTLVPAWTLADPALLGGTGLGKVGREGR